MLEELTKGKNEFWLNITTRRFLLSIEYILCEISINQGLSLIDERNGGTVDLYQSLLDKHRELISLVDEYIERYGMDSRSEQLTKKLLENPPKNPYLREESSLKIH